MAKHRRHLSRIAFWLVPTKPERRVLSREIATFAEQHASPVFLPHVTLYSCKRSDAQEELSLLASLTKHYSPVTMAVDSLGGKDRLAQAFCLKLRRNEIVEEMSRNLADSVPCPSYYSFNPHLSLIYQDLTNHQRKMLKETWISPCETIHFDQLWAVAIPSRIKEVQDFYGWQPMLICKLDSCRNVATL